MFRTLEEKFLADFAALEAERDALREEVEALRKEFESKRESVTLDMMVREAGRKAVFDKYTDYRYPDTEKHAYEEWCVKYISTDYYDKPKLPSGLSATEFVNYFAREFEAAYDEAMSQRGDE